MDDVINVTGHRLGTAEVEDVLVSKVQIFGEGHKSLAIFHSFFLTLLSSVKS